MSNEKISADAIERLRVSREAHQREQREAGLHVGRQWAEQMAEYVELKRLWEFYDRTPSAHEWDFTWEESDDNYPGGTFHGIIHPDIAGREDVDEFWTTIAQRYTDFDNGDELAGDGDFVQGFAEGAIDVYRQL
jgi:hypothetical protein